jgi:hypothetical protein
MATVTRIAGASKYLGTRLAELDSYEVAAGWFKSAVYSKGDKPVAYIAAIQEFGYAPKNIPPRMGLRQMIEAYKGKYASASRAIAKKVLAGADVREQLDVVGQIIASDIQRTISQVYFPPLEQSTLENRARRLGLKGSSALTFTGGKPLVDTGYMLASVQYMVAPKGTAALVSSGLSVK